MLKKKSVGNFNTCSKTKFFKLVFYLSSLKDAGNSPAVIDKLNRYGRTGTEPLNTF